MNSLFDQVSCGAPFQSFPIYWFAFPDVFLNVGNMHS